MKHFGKGIAVTAGFDLNAKAPLDSRAVVTTKAALESMDDIKKYDGLTVYVEDERRSYKLVNNEWKIVIDEVVNNLTDGGIDKALSADQGRVLKTQLDSTDSTLSMTTDITMQHQANNSIHVTQPDKDKWNDTYRKAESDKRYGSKEIVDHFLIKGVEPIVASNFEVGSLSRENGEPTEEANAVRTSDFISVKPDTLYYIENSKGYAIYPHAYSNEKAFISCTYENSDHYTTPSDCHYLKFRTSESKEENSTDVVFKLYENADFGHVRIGKQDKIDFGKYSIENYTIPGDESDILSIKRTPNTQSFNIVELLAPTDEPYESTLCLSLKGNDSNYFTDFSLMNYPDMEKPVAEINCQSRGGYELPEFAVKFNNGSGKKIGMVVKPDANIFIVDSEGAYTDGSVRMRGSLNIDTLATSNKKVISASGKEIHVGNGEGTTIIESAGAIQALIGGEKKTLATIDNLGGNADTVDNKHVDNSQDDALWTGTKIKEVVAQKADLAGNKAQDFNAKNITIQGDLLAKDGTGTQNIGSPENPFGHIYVNEAHLASNTLYIDGVPVIGSTHETIDIKADPGQGVMVRTTGLGATKIVSENQVQISTNGMNADVNVTATGSGSKTNISGDQQVNLTAPDINMDGNTVIKKNLVVNGDLTVKGTNTTIDTTTLTVEDNIIEVNKGQTGNGVSKGMAGLSINRGDLDDQLMVFDESDDKFKVGIQSALKAIATEDFVSQSVANKAEASHVHNYAGSASAGGPANSALVCTGNATTATKLQTPVTINDVPFDGSSPITIEATPSEHVHGADDIRQMTGYTKSDVSGEISASDTLNTAIRKLEKALEGKPGESHTHTSKEISLMTGYSIAEEETRIAPSDNLNKAIGKIEYAVTTRAKTEHKHKRSDISDFPTSLPANGGNATTADRLATSRKISLTKDITGSAMFNGQSNIEIAATIMPDTHNHSRFSRTALDNDTIDLDTLSLFFGDIDRECYIAKTEEGIANITNLPVREPFTLDIDLIEWKSQEDFTSKQTLFAATSKVTYERYCTNKVWDEWKKIYTESNPPTPTEIGAALASHGTHVSYHAGTPAVAGTASAGVASTVSRGDHVHPAQTTITGNAGTATKWQTARTLKLSGDVTGSVSIDGSTDITLTATVADNSHNHTNYALTSHKHEEITVKDIRDTAPTPDEFANRTVTAFFNNHATYGGSWQSGITVGGWTRGYAVWQMKGPSLEKGSKWHLRSGVNSEWGEWYELYHSGNKPTPEAIGAAKASHGTHVTYATTTPLVASGSGNAGSSSDVARGNHVHPAQTSVTGNAGTATKWQTARTLTLTGGATGKVTFDGSDNMTLDVTVVASEHTHDELTPSEHIHKSSDITTMEGYTKGSSATPIIVSDSLNVAIGKLEKALDTKQAAGSYASEDHVHVGYANAEHTHEGYAPTVHGHALLTRGTYLTGESYDGSGEATWSVDATHENIGSKVVVRDESGNFAAGKVTTKEVVVEKAQLKYNAEKESLEFIFA